MKRTTRMAVALCAVLVLLVTACGSSGGEKASSTTKAGDTGGTDTPKASDNDMNPTPRDQVKQGGTLNWALTGPVVNYNPNELDGASVDSYAVLTALLPSPFIVDAEAGLHTDPNYVVSAEVTSSSPKQVVTYKLNPKAVWDDGKPVNEKDYEASWKSQSGEDADYKIAASNGYDQIESVEQGKDQFEVIVTFAKPYADWKGLFSLMIPAASSNDPKIFNEGWIDKPLASAGPFITGGTDQTAKTITLIPNPKWWGNKPKLDKIIFRAIDIDAQVDALANGEIDFIDIGPDVDTLKRAQATKGIEIRRAAGPNFRHVTINGTGPILKDLEVRRALALTINRDAIGKALLGPLGVDPTPLNNHIYMTNQVGYQDNAGEFSKSDPKKAAEILDADGWKQEGSGTRTKDGKKLSLRIVIPSQVATSQKESELMQGMLEQVGIKLKIDVVPGDDFFDKYITPGDFDLTVFSWFGTPFPVSSSKSIYVNPVEGKDGLDIQQNYARIGSPELDKLFDESGTEFDSDKLIKIANEIDADIWKEVHSLTLYQRPDIAGAKATLANYGAQGFQTVKYEDIGFTA